MKTTNLRVISGRFKGQILASPESTLTHPMGAREKNALFNMLGNLSDLKVLDLYAGSGALGIEALSRGAAEVIFVEKSPKIAKTIHQNLQNLSFGGQKTAENRENLPKTAIFTQDVLKFAEDPTHKASFDIVIADPPYDRYDPTELAPLTKLLKPGGTFVLSLPASADPPILLNLTLQTAKKYASAQLAIYQ